MNIEIILVDENAGVDESILDYKVVREYKLRENDGYIIAIGDNDRRKELFDCLLRQNKGKCVSVTARDSHVGLGAHIGVGTFIAPYAYIGSEVKISDNAIINSGGVIEHEVIVGNHTHIAPTLQFVGVPRLVITFFVEPEVRLLIS